MTKFEETVKEQRERRDQFARAAITGMLASGAAFDDRLIVSAFAIADRCLKVADATKGDLQ